MAPPPVASLPSLGGGEGSASGAPGLGSAPAGLGSEDGSEESEDEVPLFLSGGGGGSGPMEVRKGLRTPNNRTLKGTRDMAYLVYNNTTLSKI